jgi:hypothetical protein
MNFAERANHGSTRSSTAADAGSYSKSEANRGSLVAERATRPHDTARVEGG